MFQALGGPDWYSAVPLVGSTGVRAPLVELLGYASVAWLSPTQCALVVGEPIPFMDSSTAV